MRLRLLGKSICVSMLTLFSAAYAQDRSTWQVIQEDIWNPNCVECHVAGSTFAEQSGLVLTADEAYEQELTKPLKDEVNNNVNMQMADEGYDLWFCCDECNHPIPAGRHHYDCQQCANFSFSRLIYCGAQRC